MPENKTGTREKKWLVLSNRHLVAEEELRLGEIGRGQGVVIKIWTLGEVGGMVLQDSQENGQEQCSMGTVKDTK